MVGGSAPSPQRASYVAGGWSREVATTSPGSPAVAQVYASVDPGGRTTGPVYLQAVVTRWRLVRACGLWWVWEVGLRLAQTVSPLDLPGPRSTACQHRWCCLGRLHWRAARALGPLSRPGVCSYSYAGRLAPSGATAFWGVGVTGVQRCGMVATIVRFQG